MAVAGAQLCCPPVLQSMESSTRAQHGHGRRPKALAELVGPGEVLWHGGHAGQAQLHCGEAEALDHPTVQNHFTDIWSG